MSHPPSPRHRSTPPPRRVLAVGGAALITALTVGGAIGLVPGVALGQTPAEAAGAGTGTSAAPAGSGSSTAPGGKRDDGGWLTVDPPTQTDPAPSGGTEDSSVAALPPHSGSGKRIVFSTTDQRVWLVAAGGDVIRTYLVSGSLHDNLQPGTYEVYSRSRHATSYTGNETMNYMVRFTQGAKAAIGFHDIPRHADGTLAEPRSDLGTAQSAGCIRQWIADARALWDFAPVGTTVVVLD